jgi:hypothetical protein
MIEWQERYTKVVRRLGKGNKMEELLKAITADVQQVVNNDAVRSAGPEQHQQLGKIIHELQSLDSSTSDEAGSSTRLRTLALGRKITTPVTDSNLITKT